MVGCNRCVSYSLSQLVFCTKGNKTQFREIIQKSESERNPQEKLIATEYASDKKAFEKADKVNCLCQYTEELLKTDYGISGNKIEVIYNAKSCDIARTYQ